MSDQSQPMTGAPQGASSDPRKAATFTLDGTGRLDAPARSAAPSTTAPEPDESLEDTRAVMSEPAQSEDHSMPGEAVPSSEGMPAEQPTGTDLGASPGPGADDDIGGVEDDPREPRDDAAGRN